ncbi:MAG TPA: DUF6766 family protein [Saprospiraceae bacterium]|nr:DUF6766 family protein [Saprospiraceae bacterium]
MKFNIFKKFGFLWVTITLFIGSTIGLWHYNWKVYVADQKAHNEPIEMSAYFDQVLKSTFENWQSEFLEVIWEVLGLAFLFAVGSPVSKEGEERKEEKIDLLIKLLDPENGKKEIDKLNKKWPKK